MSHFITLVFTKENGKSVEELLAPFDENIEYAPYVKYTRDWRQLRCLKLAI